MRYIYLPLFALLLAPNTAYTANEELDDPSEHQPAAAAEVGDEDIKVAPTEVHITFTPAPAGVVIREINLNDQNHQTSGPQYSASQPVNLTEIMELGMVPIDPGSAGDIAATSDIQPLSGGNLRATALFMPISIGSIGGGNSSATFSQWLTGVLLPEGNNKKFDEKKDKEKIEDPEKSNN